jgi:hypothetical protein
MRSRVTLAVIGIVLLGGAGVVAGVLSAPRPPARLANLQANQPTATSTDSSSTASSSTATATATKATPTVPQVAPTATATRVPPTPTPIPVPGQQLTVRGSVTSVNQSANTFVVHVFNGGGTYTCTVTPGSTQWSGAASGISTLVVGMRVDASGIYQIYQGGSGLAASRVDAQIDN